MTEVARKIEVVKFQLINCVKNSPLGGKGGLKDLSDGRSLSPAVYKYICDKTRRICLSQDKTNSFHLIDSS